MIKIRFIEQLDRQTLVSILNRIENFRPMEISVAKELIEQCLDNSSQKDYIIKVAEDKGNVVGYICYGLAPLTETTYNLYWIAVDPEYRNKGIGKGLLEDFEREVRQLGGKIIVVETSSTPLYMSANQLYKKMGYRLAAQIPNYYRQGDDLLIYYKVLEEKGEDGKVA